MSMGTNNNFMKKAFDTLVERGVITSDKLGESTVTDDLIQKFEQEMDIVIPSEVRDYLKAYSHSLYILGTPVPLESIDDPEVMHMIREMTPEGIAQLDEDELPYIEVVWSSVLAVPKDNPLNSLKENIITFRFLSNLIKNEEVTEEKLKRFLPIGDWMCAGPICFDTERYKEDVNLDDPKTWQLRWFDHEEFDWQREEYIDDKGKVIGHPLFPDIETFIKLYFYGIFDKAFQRQNISEGEEQPDTSTWSK